MYRVRRRRREKDEYPKEVRSLEEIQGLHARLGAVAASVVLSTSTLDPPKSYHRQHCFSLHFAAPKFVTFPSGISRHHTALSPLILTMAWRPNCAMSIFGSAPVSSPPLDQQCSLPLRLFLKARLLNQTKNCGDHIDDRQDTQKESCDYSGYVHHPR